MRIIWFLTGLCFVSGSVSGSISGDEKGIGMFFGKKFAYFASAPAGWVLDSQNGLAENLPMVFYPAKYKYKKSPVVVYGLSIIRPQVRDPITSQVNQTVALFVKKGNPSYRKTKKIAFKSVGRSVPVYHFQGGKNGNHEATAYYLEKHSINFIVYSARNKKLFAKYYKDYQKILKSYKNVYDRQEKLSRSDFSAKKKAANRLFKSRAGIVYRRRMLPVFSGNMANFLKSCLRINQNVNSHKIDLVFNVNKDGTVKMVYVWPLTSLSNCIRGLVFTARLPRHNIVTNFQYFELTIQ